MIKGYISTFFFIYYYGQLELIIYLLPFNLMIIFLDISLRPPVNNNNIQIHLISIIILSVKLLKREKRCINEKIES